MMILLATYTVIAVAFSIGAPIWMRKQVDQYGDSLPVPRAEMVRLTRLNSRVYIALGLIWPVVVVRGVHAMLTAGRDS